MSDPPPQEGRPNLAQISTHWSLVRSPSHFVLRYGPAIRDYLDALVKNSTDAEEILQEFLLRVVKRGFDRADRDRGRFRFYVKTAIRNAAFTYLRRKRGLDRTGSDLSQLPAAEATDEADEAWLAGWRTCILDRAWRALDAHQRRTSGNIFCTVLRLATEFPGESSDALAARAAAQTGTELRADAFRKQLSRARRCFAKLIVSEVAETIEAATPERVEEELIGAGLMEFVKDFLPSDWRTSGTLPDPGEESTS